MHIEVQVALNFVISYLYNKLPRRRVNIFGEELEKALKEKFQGHWYPEKPYKGSAFRCLKTGDPIDKVLERAARESGVPIQDILENLPQELAVWVDPGEVSYRIGEKGLVKILFSDNIKNNNTNGDNKNNSENNSLQDEDQHTLLDREVTKTFNPEAQCFRPIECVTTTINNLSLLSSPKTPTTLTALTTITTSNQSQNTTVASQMLQQQNPILQQQNTQIISNNISPSLAPSPTLNNSYKGSPSPVPPPAFIPRTTTPLTFTTATFAQTKFGSTKLKTSSKRANRMSPTEFSNYIKARAMQQQQQQLHHHHQQQPPLGRALSPDYYFHQNQYPHHFPPPPPPRSIFESSNNQYLTPDLYSSSNGRLPFEHSTGGYYPPGPPAGTPAGTTAAPSTPQDNGGKLDNNNWTSYPNGGAGQYQHLLVAN